MQSASATGLARQLMEFGRGETGVFELRAKELQALEQVDDLLFRTNSLTQQMSVSAAEIVANAREMTDAAATTALSSLDSSRLTLSLVIGVSLLTMLGPMVYVNRSLGSRLSAFSNVTLALADARRNQARRLALQNVWLAARRPRHIDIFASVGPPRERSWRSTWPA